MTTQKDDDKIQVELVDDEGKVVETPADDKAGDKPVDEVKQFDDDLKAQLAEWQDRAKGYESKINELTTQVDEVVRFAQGTVAENKRLATLIQGGEKVLVEQADGRVKAELLAAEAAFKKAYEEGDTEKMLQAQKDIARLQVEADKVKNYQPVQVNQPAQAPIQRPAAKVDAKSQAWLDKNKDWWMKDDAMTGLAMGLHAKAVKEGVRPGTDDYIKYIDEGMSKAFPDKFGGKPVEPARQARPVGTGVAPVTRSAGNNTTKVQITPTMEAMAKRLGVPLKKYAEELLKVQ